MSVRELEKLRAERERFSQALNANIAEALELVKKKLDGEMSDTDKEEHIDKVNELIAEIQENTTLYEKVGSQLFNFYVKMVFDDDDGETMKQEQGEDFTLLQKVRKILRCLSTWLKKWSVEPVEAKGPAVELVNPHVKDHNELIEEAKVNLANSKTILTNECAKVPELLQMDISENDTRALYRHSQMLVAQKQDLEWKIANVKEAHRQLETLYVQVKDTDIPAYQFFETMYQRQTTTFCDTAYTDLAEIDLLIGETSRLILENDGHVHSPVHTEGFKSVQLPKLELPKFSGDIMKWQEFWDSFDSSIHKDKRLDIIRKFNYLKSRLSGDALKAIDGLQLTKDNYQVAIDLLSKRFGNTQMVINAHYVDLTNLPAATNDVKKLRQLFDSFERHLRTLEAAGEDIGHPQFVAMIQSKLPTEVVRQLQLMQADPTTPWSVDALRKLLERYIVAGEFASYGTKSSQANVTGSINTAKPASGGARGGNNERPMTAAFLSGQADTNSRRGKPNGNRGNRFSSDTAKTCIYCDGKHYADQCDQVTTLKERREKLRGRCFNCLDKSHQANQCTREVTCYHCKQVKKHHRSLCHKLFSGNRDRNRSEPTHLAHDTVKGDDEISALSIQNSKSHTAENTLLAAGEQVIMQTALVDVKVPNSKRTCSGRLLADSASYRSYATMAFGKRCGLKPEGTEELSVLTFGSKTAKKIQSPIVTMEIVLATGGTMKMKVNLTDTISGNLQREPVSMDAYPVLKQVKLADTLPVHHESTSIDLLLGADYYHEIMLMNKITVGDGLYLNESKLGWLLAGKIKGPVSKKRSISQMLVLGHSSGPVGLVSVGSDEQAELSLVGTPDKMLNSALDIDAFWNLDIIGIKESPYDSDDEKAAQHFRDNIKFEDGRYVVALPWKDVPDLRPPENYQLALGRLRSTVQRLQKEPDLAVRYASTIEDQEKQGIVEKVLEDTIEGPIKHYIPHHPVITPQKVFTKLRIVYDASAKTKKSNHSLNECLYRGPVMLEPLCGIHIRFRLKRIPIVADLEKAFLKIEIVIGDRDVTRFLWLKDPTRMKVDGNIQIYRFARVPFGIISSPALLAQVVDYHLKRVGSSTALQILENIYVDNLITGVDSEDEAQQFYLEAKALFADAGMNLREWTSTSPQFVQWIPEEDRVMTSTVKVLGITWSMTDDLLSVPGPDMDKLFGASTKRQVLKALASIFDPIGYFCPVTLRAKLFLQELWSLQMDWDMEIDEELLSKWQDLATDLQEIPECPIRRYIGIPGGKPEYQLLCFCDASAKIYATAIYLRQSTPTFTKVDLIFAKTRLAPQKTKITLPRLELLGNFIGATCTDFVKTQLRLPLTDCILWTDSQCVLAWLNTDKTLSVFVGRRVKAIRDIGQDYSFRYVATSQNPADFGTRGKTTAELKDCSLWWHGPDWLLKDKAEWPTWNVPDITPSMSQDFDSELKAPTVMYTASLPVGEGSHKSVEDFGKIETPFGLSEEKFSSLNKLLGVTVFANRFVDKLRCRSGEKRKVLSQEEKRKIDPPTAMELEKAKQMWIRYVQRNSKPYREPITALESGKRNNLVSQLNLQLDDYGIIRSHGRYEHTELPEGARLPKLLPKDAYFTKLVIQNVHEKLLHSGVSHTLAQLRYEYWIPQGRAAVQNVLYQCRVCRKVEGGPFKMPNMPAWPRKRVAKSAPFTYTGLDYLGPLYIKKPGDPKESRKVWVCIFTCLAVRAIHLEIIEDMSAEQFLLCLRRFIARRGTPLQITSDNAAQFKVSKDVIDKLWQDVLLDTAVKSYVAKHSIQWIFIVQLAPWMGGFYERLVGQVKRNLRKSIGKARLTLLQLQTFLMEAEAAVNSRPLTYVDGDIKSNIALSPSFFLSLNPSIGIPEHVMDDQDPEFVPEGQKSSAQQLVDTWKVGQKHLNNFWKMWQDDYLLSLRERYQSSLKHGHIQSPFVPKVGDVVLIKEALTTRGTWQIGKVHELHESADSQIRSATVLLPNKHTLTRALNFLYPIECPIDDDMSDCNNVMQNEPIPFQPDVDSVTSADDNDSHKSDDSQPSLSRLSQHTAQDVQLQPNTGVAVNTQTVPTTGRPTRRAAVEARKKLKKWLNPAEDTFLCLGSVVTMASRSSTLECGAD